MRGFGPGVVFLVGSGLACQRMGISHLAYPRIRLGGLKGSGPQEGLRSPHQINTNKHKTRRIKKTTHELNRPIKKTAYKLKNYRT